MKQKHLHWSTLLKNKTVWFSILVCFAGILNVNYWTGYMVVELSEKYEFSEVSFGYLVMSLHLIYILSCYLLPRGCKNSPRRLLFMIAFMGFAICQAIFGIWDILYSKYHYLKVINGLPLLGLFHVFALIPVLPEIYERLIFEFQIKLGEHEEADMALQNMCLNLFVFVQSLSMLVSPLIGGALFMYFERDSSRVTYVIFITDIAVFVFLFVFNGDFKVFKENRTFQ